MYQSSPVLNYTHTLTLDNMADNVAIITKFSNVFINGKDLDEAVLLFLNPIHSMNFNFIVPVLGLIMRQFPC